MIRMAGIEVDEERLADICRRWKIAELSVFGSVARGDAGPDSDLDLLYVFQPDAVVGWDIVRLEDELSELFGRKVDLVSKRYLNPRMRNDVLAEARVLYAA
jgi:predicted nucleotidyltransferase